MNFLDQMFTESELTMEDNFELEKTKLALQTDEQLVN
jgi:hypothetical protein